MHVSAAHACVCMQVCGCKRLGVRSPLGRQPPPTILQHLPVWCQALTPAVCLSLFSAKQPNPSRTLLKKIVKTYSFKNEWKLYSPPPSHTALLEIITQRIGKLCQNKDNMTSKSSRAKKHRSDVMCSLCVICWSLFMGVMSLCVGISIPWYVTLTVKIKLSLSLSIYISSKSKLLVDIICSTYCVANSIFFFFYV